MSAAVSQLEHPLPHWLAAVVHEVAEKNHWQEDRFNDGVAFHLSSRADRAADHLEFGTFPRDGTPPGLVVSVPSAEYLLALKLKAARALDPVRRVTERLDILNPMQVVGISTVEEAIALLGRYFPVSAAAVLPNSRRGTFSLRKGRCDGPVNLIQPRYRST
jgi:hypothetical protein